MANDNNQYTIIPAKSEVKDNLTENVFAAYISKFEEANAIVWYYDKIVFLQNKDWVNELKDLSAVVRLRLFDTEKELHIWQSNGELKGRFREDGKGDACEYVESKQILNWNESLKDLGFDKTNVDKAKVKLIARNYIDCSDIGQAGYVDCRFIDIV